MSGQGLLISSQGSPPMISLREIEPEEYQYSLRLLSALTHLGLYVTALEGAVRLFQHARSCMTAQAGDEMRLLGEWCFIAARDATGSIYKFSEEMKHLTVVLNQMPKLRARLDGDAKKRATRGFAKLFPDFLGLRHSAQHSAGEIYGVDETFNGHKVEGENSMLMNSLLDDKYTTTFRGRRIELELSDGVIVALRQVRDDYWASFAPINVLNRRRQFPATPFERDR